MSPSPYRTVIEAMFCVVDKHGVAVDFRLNDVQARLDSGWTRRNIIPKARQEGVSSYVIARFVAKCLGEQNRRCVIVSHETDATQRLLDRADYILKNLKGGVQPELGRHSRAELFFKKTNSTLWIGTAGSRNFGHGDTITDLHLSEAARYADTKSIVEGTFPAAEHGEITVESTGQGVGNWFHRQCVRAREGVGFKLFFFSWLDDPGYSIDFATSEDRDRFAASLNDELEEPALAARGISLEQLQWRRERLTIDYECDLRMFKQAYPLDFDECFQSTRYGFFRRVRHVDSSDWHRVSAHVHALSTHPRPGLHYVLGGDPAGGVGLNNSVAEVFCLETREQVAEYASSAVEPDQFGRDIAALAAQYNYAYVNVERNNHGLTTIATLVNKYPVWLLHKATHGEQSNQEVLTRLSHYGTLVGPANRGLLIGTARRLLADEFTIYSPTLKSELSTFVEKEDGKIEADSGCFDDHVFAAVHALTVLERAGIMAGDGPTPQADKALETGDFVLRDDSTVVPFDAIFGDIENGDRREKHGTPQVYH